MNTDSLERLDSYPYRYRVADVMTAPLASLSAGESLLAAARAMIMRRSGSLLVDLQGAAGGPGILTERDLLRLLAEEGGRALALPVEQVMSRPLITVPSRAFLFVAIGRMDRYRIRHLVACDDEGKPVGMVSARDLLHQRARHALILGDEVGDARDGAVLAGIRERLPVLARALRAEGVAASEIAAVVGYLLCDISAQAARIAAALTTEGAGPAPAEWSYLVLGSAGRGESLLTADQDNAIVHAGSEAADSWYATVGRRASDILDEAGIPYCQGGVMASEAAWRSSLEGWKRRIDSWVRRAEAERLLSVDIFYDFRLVYGNGPLAGALRQHAAVAGQSDYLLRMLGQQLAEVRAPIGLLGQLQTDKGWLDLKLHGLFPIVAGARTMALALGEQRTSTVERLHRLAEAGLIGTEDHLNLRDAWELFMALLLDQQLNDLAEGRRPGNSIDVRAMTPTVRARLKSALRQAAEIRVKVIDVVTERRS